MNSGVKAFSETLENKGLELERNKVTTLQINVGKKCNQACTHCHVEAGPKRTEDMDETTANRIIELMEYDSLELLDITGGAPEINPYFEKLAVAGRERGLKVIDRCNLTIFFEEGKGHLPEFLASNKIDVVASLPCYSKENVDTQRGGGTFDKSIKGLQMLNDLGYGKEGSGLEIDLVYNPNGAYLPPSQDDLQAEYKKELKELFNIEFNNLYTITNMPIKRFLHYLEREELLEEYMATLLENFNPASLDGLMCKSMISISWDGFVYDCDFNQMIELPIGWKKTSIWEIDSLKDVAKSTIAIDDHCYGCTAGAGSSCQGAVA